MLPLVSIVESGFTRCCGVGAQSGYCSGVVVFSEISHLKFRTSCWGVPLRETTKYSGALADTISVRLAEMIRQDILYSRDGYKPGSRIMVDQLVENLQISATPVKEALKQLTADGLVVVRPRRGFFVTNLTERDLEEAISLRECLERWSLRLSNGVVSQPTLSQMRQTLGKAELISAHGDVEGFTHADMGFHRLVASVGQNRTLSSSYEQLMVRSHIANYLYSPRLGRPAEQSIAEHRELISIFTGGDLATEEEALTAHWARSLERMLAGYRDYANAHREKSSLGIVPTLTGLVSMREEN